MVQLPHHTISWIAPLRQEVLVHSAGFNPARCTCRCLFCRLHFAAGFVSHLCPLCSRRCFCLLGRCCSFSCCLLPVAFCLPRRNKKDPRRRRRFSPSARSRVRVRLRKPRLKSYVRFAYLAGWIGYFSIGTSSVDMVIWPSSFLMTIHLSQFSLSISG